ncbi:hypothetical protein [Trichococcus collinsii]|uniref:Uncharacterized protein n=1 Tax=Trichococcus collinsii TaxID=157076 RepID=A0AB37ZXS9_9LACT|nr:hypothetical protein [Trichococcus collinsii]CZR03617.1 Hypothetical protein Tcol_2178 [Trichococcus collinsii]SEA00604.1 hypothetical protein SAMN04488525_101847 [Trichococcus collinsii]
MRKFSFVKCELDYGTGNHRISMSGNIEELSYVSVLIANNLRAECLKLGLTDEQAKGVIIGGIEKFWGDPNVGGRSEQDENISK